MAMIEIIEIFHFNETWQSYTKARGNCHISLIVVAATIDHTPSYGYIPSYDNNAPTDSSQYDNTPSEPYYYDSNIYQDSSYHEDYTPSYDDIHPVYRDHLEINIHDHHPPSEPTYFTGTDVASHGIASELELELYAKAATNRSYTQEEIHPAYRDHLVDNNYVDTVNIYPSGTTTDQPPHDYTASSLNNNYTYDFFSNEELTEEAQCLEEMLEEISDVLALAWPETMALAWLSLALASLFPGQSQTPWPGPGLGLAWLKPWLTRLYKGFDSDHGFTYKT